MAYYLLFDGSNDHVTLGSQIDIASGDNFSIKMRFPANTNSGNHRVLGGANLGASSPRVIAFANGTVTVYGSSGGNIAFSLSIDISVDRELEIRRVSGQMGIYYDGVLQGSTQSSTQTFTGFAVLGGNFNTATVSSKLYYLSFSINGTLIAYYDPSATGGTGSILEDTTGINDGTLVNFPVNDSQWVFYDDGGGVSLTLSSLIHSQDLGNILLNQNHNILTSNISQENPLQNVTLTQVSTLLVDELFNNHIIDEITLTSENLLQLGDIYNDQVVSNVNLSVMGQISTNGVVHTHLLDNVVISENNILAVTDLINNQNLGQIVLATVGVASVESISQEQVLSSVTLLQNFIIPVGGITHTQTLGNITPTISNSLNLQDLDQIHILENLNITQEFFLVINNLDNSQTLNVIFFKDIPDLTKFIISYGTNPIRL